MIKLITGKIEVQQIAVLNFLVSKTSIENFLPQSLTVHEFQNQAQITLFVFSKDCLKINNKSLSLIDGSYYASLITYVSDSRNSGIYPLKISENGSFNYFPKFYKKLEIRNTSDNSEFNSNLKDAFTIKNELKKSGNLFLFNVIHKHLSNAICSIDKTYCYPIEEVKIHLKNIPILDNSKLKEAFWIDSAQINISPYNIVINPIIFFDSTCGFCGRCVRLLLSLDKKRILKIAPIDGVTSKKILGDKELPDRLILVDDLGLSDGALALIRVLDYLSWPKFLFYPFKLFPINFLNWCYDKVAKNRHRCNLKSQLISDDRLLP